ncbi:hypothetical protein C1645_835160 [Glomus cerebriforme]|uniref:DUF8211 domain-containing protein n=1 Tax=Glomus cerebriforme TaxID=658196 RepID=A0A397SCZ7_9GLOM|nr:hypothetical protein C1645_835160 [Glomus cerebriforme]
MSNYRRGCSHHQKWLYADQISNDRPSNLKHADAAKAIHDKYKTRSINHVVNNRLGISYNTQIKVLHNEHHSSHHTPYIYTKLFRDYRIVTSSSSTAYTKSTLSKQEIRHTRCYV